MGNYATFRGKINEINKMFSRVGRGEAPSPLSRV
jgi:hypothetical protein